MNAHFLIALVLTFFTNLGISGHEVGHGGWGCVEFDKENNPTRAELLEYWEARIVDKLNIISTKPITDLHTINDKLPNEIIAQLNVYIQPMLDALSKTNEFYFGAEGELFNFYKNDILSMITVLSDEAAPAVPGRDFNLRAEPVRCKLVPLAYNNGENIQIDRRYLPVLPTLHLAGLLVHETLAAWTKLAKRGSFKTTDFVRLVNGRLTHYQLGNDTSNLKTEFKTWFEKHMGRQIGKHLLGTKTYASSSLTGTCEIYSQKDIFLGLAYPDADYKDIGLASSFYRQVLGSDGKFDHQYIAYINTSNEIKMSNQVIATVDSRFQVHSLSGKLQIKLDLINSTILNSKNEVLGYFLGCQGGSQFYLIGDDTRVFTSKIKHLARVASLAYALFIPKECQTCITYLSNPREMAPSLIPIVPEDQMLVTSRTHNGDRMRSEESGIFSTFYNVMVSYTTVPK